VLKLLPSGSDPAMIPDLVAVYICP